MLNKILWREPNGKLIDTEIKKVENQLEVKFPKDYLDVVRVNDGAYPSPNRFEVNNHEEIFNNLLSFKEDDYSNIVETLEDVSDRMIERIIPIAEDPFGNFICFDFRNEKQTILVFWNHEGFEEKAEKSLSFICNSFTELLGMLHSD